jgi:hypothetical protein
VPPRRPVLILPMGAPTERLTRMPVPKTAGNYRVHWEGVGTSRLHLYMNADPMSCTNCRQNVPNSSIPEADWHPVHSMTTADPWEQYDQLKRWELNGYGFVRNVRLTREIHPAQWVEVDRKDERIP